VYRDNTRCRRNLSEAFDQVTWNGRISVATVSPPHRVPLHYFKCL
jgi:hypothetical protein